MHTTLIHFNYLPDVLSTKAKPSLQSKAATLSQPVNQSAILLHSTSLVAPTTLQPHYYIHPDTHTPTFRQPPSPLSPDPNHPIQSRSPECSPDVPPPPTIRTPLIPLSTTHPLPSTKKPSEPTIPVILGLELVLGLHRLTYSVHPHILPRSACPVMPVCYARRCAAVRVCLYL
jgi:hypothetical protein